MDPTAGHRGRCWPDALLKLSGGHSGHEKNSMGNLIGLGAFASRWSASLSSPFVVLLIAASCSALAKRPSERQARSPPQHVPPSRLRRGLGTPSHSASVPRTSWRRLLEILIAVPLQPPGLPHPRQLPPNALLYLHQNRPNTAEPGSGRVLQSPVLDMLQNHARMLQLAENRPSSVFARSRARKGLTWFPS